MFPLVGYMLLFVAVGAAFILVNLLAGWLIRPVRPHQEKETIYECGEPTIGSAWVQFDLRFYVVALLFVIFDVEVAFFFPWADVFGKANTAASDSTQITQQQRLDAAYVLAPQQSLERESNLRASRTLLDDKLELEAIRRRVEQGKPLKARHEAELLKSPPRIDPPEIVDEVQLGLQKIISEVKADSAAGYKLVAFIDSRLIPAVEKTIQDNQARIEKLDAQVLKHAEENRGAARGLAWIALWDILVFFGVLLVGFAYLWKRGDLQWVKAVTSDTAKPLARIQHTPSQLAGTGS